MGLEAIQPLSLSPSNPLAGETVTAQFTIKNNSDQPITLDRLLVGVHGPNCSDWSCPNVADFPAIENRTLEPNEEFQYTQQRTFSEVGTGYFAEPTYMDAAGSWRQMGGRINFSVSPGVQVVEQLTLTPANPLINQTVTARYKVRNAGTRPITLRRLGVVARGPNCSDWTCNTGGDFPQVENVTLAPAEEYVYSQQRSFSQPGSGYLAEPAFEDSNTWWFPLPGGNRVTFTVSVVREFVRYFPLVESSSSALDAR